MTGSAADDTLDREPPGNFLCGVVEGFYGRPWTADQRKLLFKWMSNLGMNTYTYAPKDDYKHRMYWRDLYSIEEAENLTCLIEASNERNVTFVYAISPGLDITYSSAKDVTFLKRKLEQVSSFGCKAFALLFDDIDLELCEADKSTYQSAAHAQVSVTNEIYQHLNEPMFLFCPTEYCAARAVPQVSESLYLTTVGAKLLPAVQIMWTGPKVVSRRLTIESLDEITKVLKRPPLIWDNIHANDYDPKRLFLGPYEGRSPEIIPYITGVLTNPNCEFEANFVALHTLAQWRRSNCNGIKKDTITADVINPVVTDIKLEKDEIEEVVSPLPSQVENGEEELCPYDERYQPRVALRSALGDWVMEFYVGREPLKIPLPLVDIIPDVTINTSTPAIDVTGVKTCLVVTQSTITQTQSCTTEPTTTSSVVQTVPSIQSLDNSDDVDMRPVIDTSPLAQLENPEPHIVSSRSNDTIIYEHDDQYSTTSDVKNMDLEPMDSDDNISISATPPLVTLKPKTSDSDMQVDSDCENGAKPLSSFVKMNTSPPTLSISTFTKKPIDPLSQPLVAHLPSQLIAKDLELLVDLFYMPFEHGSTGVKMLNVFYWLKTHAHFMHSSKTQKYTDDEIKEWREKCESFSVFVDSVSKLAEKLAKIPNRAILYDLFPYIWDIKGILTACNGYNKWLERGLVPPPNTSQLSSSHFWFCESYKETLIDGAQEPWMFRGGLQAEFHRLLPVEGAHDLFMIRPPDNIDLQEFHIRPYQLSDEPKIYEICSDSYHSTHPDETDAFTQWPELIGDSLVGGLTALSYEYCFLVEDSNGILGYCLCALDAKDYHDKYVTAWVPAMCQKYPKTDSPVELEATPAQKLWARFHTPPQHPSDFIHRQHPSVIHMNLVHDLVHDKSIPKRLLISALSALRTNRSTGVHCVINATDMFMYDFYTKLGFFQINHMDETGDAGLVFMGRLI